MDGAERHVCVRREPGDLCEAGWAGVIPRSRDVAHRAAFVQPSKPGCPQEPVGVP
ncbi:unnamed protein product [Rangifer tarandus platyrhynchus]|uniref:Uncharacterized protein n=1 Tax=Rangifer tarandus platyrhynchus TaxID=3082113 RepID=A0AC60A2X6_RANTA